MRKSAAELLSHHRPLIGVAGATVFVAFADPVVAMAYQDRLLIEPNEIPRSATRLVRTLSLVEGPEPNRTVLELVDGDGRAHRFFVCVDDLRTLAAIPIVASGPGEPVQLDEPEHLDAERKDDLLELAFIHTRLDRADGRIEEQRQALDALRTAVAERWTSNRHLPSYCCQCCGEVIGWTGRIFQAIGVPLHRCTHTRGEA